MCEAKGFTELLIIGGGIVNSAFLKENLIDEIFLSIHPTVLGDGIKLFSSCEITASLKLLDYKQLKDDLIQLHYLVNK
ncbi:MAG: dihydrofolate reductase family protein [bacterium]|nr:dihydrofolate reductase family protein [bacterium]